MKMIKAATEHAELVGYVHSNAWKRHLASSLINDESSIKYFLLFI